MPEPAQPVFVITRPAHQAEKLSSRLQQADLTVIRFPVIEIQPPSNSRDLVTIIERLKEFDLAIFISANAVSRGMAVVEAQGGWPSTLSIAAIGQATAKSLKDIHHPPDLVAPPPYNSEALLALPEFRALNGKRIIVFRGEGGRDLLAQTLSENGAIVEYANCYRRVIPDHNDSVLRREWDANHELVFVVTSNEGLQNLYNLISPAYREKLQSSRLIVVSTRIRELADALGFTHAVMVSRAASDEAILETVEDLLGRKL